MAMSNKLGYDKEPPSRTPKLKGKGAVIHSHGLKPKRSLKVSVKK
jgi:hypothetical protein